MGPVTDEATGPLKGFRVVELAMWAAGPMVGGILADWGADVIKIESADGDPFRALNLRPGKETVTETSLEFLVNNRAKRSIVLDVKTEEGRRIALELIHQADVFLTNLRSNALERMGLDYETVHKIEPGLVYCHVTGYGVEGEWRDKAAYDVGAFYARAGVAATLLPPGDEPMMRCGAFGDYYTAMAAAAGVCAALVARQQSGQGQRVVGSLLRTGAYAISAHLDRVIHGTPPRAVKSRAEILNPMNNCYRDSQGKWFWLLGLQGDRMWPGVTRAIGQTELEADPRFDTMETRAENAAELTAHSGRRLRQASTPGMGADLRTRRYLVDAGKRRRRLAERPADARRRRPGQAADLSGTTRSKSCRRQSISMPRHGKFAAPLPSSDSIPKRSCWNWGATGTKSPV